MVKKITTTMARWKSVCDSCRDEAVQELIKKKLKKKEEECQAK